ncbi:hypothetical protein B0T16DRAFT_189834 [Cercophora newfieldiana]|uniref:Uncharacterized protein n=1 Tax=Cercophora newfieldiana TaxID=92897 RepID=A0AA40CNU0_9PEZI|nr:hypothetical protein B0T16DRAFT_189834 [Cercophora newfieldiana]
MPDFTAVTSCGNQCLMAPGSQRLARQDKAREPSAFLARQPSGNNSALRCSAIPPKSYDGCIITLGAVWFWRLGSHGDSVAVMLDEAPGLSCAAPESDPREGFADTGRLASRLRIDTNRRGVRYAKRRHHCEPGLLSDGRVEVENGLCPGSIVILCDSGLNVRIWRNTTPSSRPCFEPDESRVASRARCCRTEATGTALSGPLTALRPAKPAGFFRLHY